MSDLLQTPKQSGSDEQPPSLPWRLGCGRAEEALSALVSAHAQRVPAGKLLQIENDESTVVYLIVSGWLTVSKISPDGQRQIVDFLLPGNVFDPGSADEIMASTDVNALTDAQIAVVPRASWFGFLADHPQAHELAIRLGAAGYARIAERLLRMGRGNAETRVAYAFCELGLRASDRGLVAVREFHLPLNQPLLGDFVGLSSVHVSRTISGLVRRGLLSYGDHMDIVIHDIEGLAELAEVDPHDLRREILTAAREGRPAVGKPDGAAER